MTEGFGHQCAAPDGHNASDPYVFHDEQTQLVFEALGHEQSARAFARRLSTKCVKSCQSRTRPNTNRTPGSHPVESLANGNPRKGSGPLNFDGPEVGGTWRPNVLRGSVVDLQPRVCRCSSQRNLVINLKTGNDMRARDRIRKRRKRQGVTGTSSAESR